MERHFHERSRHTLRFLGTLVSMNLRSAFALRGAFWLQAGFMAANNILYFTFWWIFFDRFEEIGGWRLPHMAALYGIVAAGYGLSIVFAGGLRDLSRQIIEGDLDPFLTQPKSPLLYLAASRTHASGWGDLGSGVAFLSLSGLVAWSSAPLAVVAVLASACVFTASAVLFHSLAFWLGRVDALARQLFEFLLTFSLYPSTIFTGVLKFVLFTVVPAGFIGYLPLSLVRNSSWESLISVVGGAFGYAALAILVFGVGLARYQSGNRFGIRA